MGCARRAGVLLVAFSAWLGLCFLGLGMIAVASQTQTERLPAGVVTALPLGALALAAVGAWVFWRVSRISWRWLLIGLVGGVMVGGILVAIGAATVDLSCNTWHGDGCPPALR